MAVPSHIKTVKHDTQVDDDTMRQIAIVNPKKFVDFGAGDGFYGKLVKYLFPECNTTGIEVEESYVEKFKLVEVYDELVVGDIRDFINSHPADNGYDLAIFGDVIEHLEEDEAKKIIKAASDLFPYTIINSPLGFIGQPSDIPSEIHRCGLERHMFNDCVVAEWHVYYGNPLNTMFNCLLRGAK